MTPGRNGGSSPATGARSAPRAAPPLREVKIVWYTLTAMGHDITYCSICHEQIRWQDLQDRQAFKLDDRSFCLKCGPEMLRSLPKERVKELFQNLSAPERKEP